MCPMRHIKYRDVRKSNYKYILVEDYVIALPLELSLGGTSVATPYIRLSSDGVLTIKAGYASDGPSGPTLDTRSFMRGAFVHDALYQLLREGVLPQKDRKTADQILRLHCREDGMGKLRAAWVYYGLRLFGGYAAKRRPRPKTLTAP